VLWHEGGIYLDTDILVLRPLSTLKNTVGEEHVGEGYHSLSNAVMSFDEKHPFIWAAMQEFSHRFVRFGSKSFPELIRNGEWGQNGPKLLTRVLTNYEAITEGGAPNLSFPVARIGAFLKCAFVFFSFSPGHGAAVVFVLPHKTKPNIQVLSPRPRIRQSGDSTFTARTRGQTCFCDSSLESSLKELRHGRRFCFTFITVTGTVTGAAPR